MLTETGLTICGHASGIMIAWYARTDMPQNRRYDRDGSHKKHFA